MLVYQRVISRSFAVLGVNAQVIVETQGFLQTFYVNDIRSR